MDASCEVEVRQLWTKVDSDVLTIEELSTNAPIEKTIEKLIIFKMQLNLEIDKGEQYWEQQAQAN
ncbi:hypothetical protein EPI10_024578 [Gossypium australe]|uniref:Uncharacterized protein n=1 Tax=Gossypium australe TaxID=47621 RepID=A0A5B6VZL9_9ROSI|nr:hypothetical protein EPI10_024578 [Gossypium australe]